MKGSYNRICRITIVLEQSGKYKDIERNSVQTDLETVGIRVEYAIRIGHIRSNAHSQLDIGRLDIIQINRVLNLNRIRCYGRSGGETNNRKRHNKRAHI